MIDLVEIVVGKNRFLVLQKVAEIIGGINDNFERYDFSTKNPNFDFFNVLEAIQTVSLFNQDRLIFLHIEEDKDMKLIDVNELIAVIENPGDVKVIIAMEKRIPQSQKLGKFIKKHAKMHELKVKDGFNKQRYLSKALFDKQMKMTPHAQSEFLERIGEDYARMDSELEKLSLLDKEIELHDIENMITQDINDHIFTISNALLNKDRNEAFRIYHSLLAQKNDPLNLGPLIASSLRSIYQVETLYYKGYTQQQIGERLQMSDKQVWVILNRQMGKVQNILEHLNHLSEIDQKSKLGEVDRFIAFELFMLNIMH